MEKKSKEEILATTLDKLLENADLNTKAQLYNVFMKHLSQVPTQPNSEEKWCPCSKNIEEGNCSHSPKPEEEQIFTEEDFIKAEDFTHTSNEWEKILEIFFPVLCSKYSLKNVPRGVYYDMKEFISDILSQSEQRVRKEMVEVLGKHNARILNYFQQQGTPDMPMIAYDERVCLIPAMNKATEETLSLLSNPNV